MTGSGADGGSEAPRQQTLASAVSREGTGLHSGEPVELEIRPADPDTGVRCCPLGAQS